MLAPFMFLTRAVVVALMGMPSSTARRRRRRFTASASPLQLLWCHAKRKKILSGCIFILMLPCSICGNLLAVAGPLLLAHNNTFAVASLAKAWRYMHLDSSRFLSAHPASRRDAIFHPSGLIEAGFLLKKAKPCYEHVAMAPAAVWKSWKGRFTTGNAV